MQATNARIETLTVSPEAINGPIAAKVSGREFQYENNNYKINLTDDGTVHIFNQKTGEDYRIWGDPHVAVDGKQAFDFYGDTTFKLDDGTKVTIETKPAANNAKVTYASTVTITDGTTGQTTQVTGVDPFTRGDLAMSHHINDAARVEARVGDGNVIKENPFGKGFLGVDGNGKLAVVDQAFINATDHRLNGLDSGGNGPEGLFDSLQPYANMLAFFSGLIGITLSGSLLSAETGETTISAGDLQLPPNFEFSLVGPNAF